MRILLISNYFPPEIGAASHLYYELAQGLVKQGHSVSVLTGTPRYNIDNVAKAVEEAKALDSSAPFRVIRVSLPNISRAALIRRGIEQFEIAWKFATSKSISDYDVAIIYSPPLTLGLTGVFLERRFKAPFILNVQDLFPQSAIDLGVLRNSFLIRGFEQLERILYRKAAFVTVHSEGNAEHIFRKGGPHVNVKVVPNWVNTNEIRPGQLNNAFRKEIGYERGVFLVTFAGTLGYSQDLDVVIDAAKLLLKIPKIQFLIVGDGVEKSRLVKRVKNENVHNVRFAPMQPKERYPEVLAASNASLVTLKSDVQTPVVPSKLLSIMAAGRPVIAAMPVRGDAPKLISSSNCGICVEPGDAVGLASAIKNLYYGPELAATMAAKGREFVEHYFSIEAAVKCYEELFYNLLNMSTMPVLRS